MISRRVLIGIVTLLLTLNHSSAQFNYKNLVKVNSFNELIYPFEVKKQALSNDIEMAYMDEGDGEQTIIFVHGLGSYAPAWKKNLEGLKSEFRCIAIDLPGYGKSSKADYSGKMTFYAETIKEFMDSLGLNRVNMAGHSMGGQISTVFSLRYPMRINSLILVAPAGIETFTEGEKDWFRNVLTAKSVALTPLSAIEDNIGYNFYKLPADAFFMVEDRYAMTGAGEEFNWYCYIIPKCVNGMVDEPVVHDYSKLKNKTLLIFGEADQLIPNRYLHGGSSKKIAEKGASIIPNCQMELIPKAGHFVNFEAHSKVNELISDFLKK